MYLVGDFSMMDNFKGMGVVKVKLTITHEDLIRSKKEEERYLVINLDTAQYFNYIINEWFDFDRD